MSQGSLQGKSYIVTGAASGMGRASSVTLARAGANVVLADWSEDAGEQAAQEIIGEGLKASFVRVDISNEASVKNMVRQAVKRHGRLDGAFNNAGVEMSFKKIHDITLEDWNRVVGINLTGAFLCMKHEIAEMRMGGGGAIVNTASVFGQVSGPCTGDYTASKHGVIGLTRATAADYGSENIRVNAILPGTIETPMILERALQMPAFAASAEGNRARHLLKRWGKPEEVGSVVAWLLSEEASFITGASIPVDGGWLAN